MRRSWPVNGACKKGRVEKRFTVSKGRVASQPVSVRYVLKKRAKILSNGGVIDISDDRRREGRGKKGGKMVSPRSTGNGRSESNNGNRSIEQTSSRNASIRRIFLPPSPPLLEMTKKKKSNPFPLLIGNQDGETRRKLSRLFS